MEDGFQMNHYPMLTTFKGTKARCGLWVNRATQANPAHPFTCPDCLALLAKKAEHEAATAASYKPGQERDFHTANARMFSAYVAS